MDRASSPSERQPLQIRAKNPDDATPPKGIQIYRDTNFNSLLRASLARLWLSRPEERPLGSTIRHMLSQFQSGTVCKATLKLSEPVYL